MKELYVIGGKSRTGKSKIAEKLRANIGRLEIASTDQFRPDGNDDLAWQRLAEHLKNEFSSDILIEGVAITPERINALDLPHLKLRKAVFLGYGRDSHAESILSYAEIAHDWVFDKIQENPEYINDVHNWMATGIPESFELKKEAEKYGYGYFDITDYENDFEKYSEKVSEYLLG